MDRQVVVTLLEDSDDKRSVTSRGRVKLKKCCIGILLFLGLIVIGYIIGMLHSSANPKNESMSMRNGYTSRITNLHSGGPLSEQNRTEQKQPLALTGNNFADVQTRINEILRYLGYLEAAGLDFYLRVSNSSCPQEVCRQCTKKLYKDSHPNVPPVRVCSNYDRVKNASCWLCEFRGNRMCYTFQEILGGQANCPGRQPTCCEKSYMADLNDYCNGGKAVCDDGRNLICNCPHGKAGGRCDQEEDTENVLCDCFNKRINLLERLNEFKVKHCNSIYYSDNITCTYSLEEENCLCKALHDTDSDSDSDINSCDNPVTHNPVTGRTPATHNLVTGRTPVTHNPMTGRTPVTHNPVTGRTPVTHNPVTGRQTINEAERSQSYNFVFLMGISLVTNTLLDR